MLGEGGERAEILYMRKFTVKYKRYSFTILYKFIYNSSAMHFSLRT